jgi:phage shock protein E
MLETALAVIALGAVLVVALFFLRPKGAAVTPEAIADARARGATIVDVRSPSEFKGGHVAGAINVPVERVVGQPSAVGAQDKPVIVYCQSGMRSGQAAGALRAAGYEVIDLGPFARARQMLGG